MHKQRKTIFFYELKDKKLEKLKEERRKMSEDIKKVKFNLLSNVKYLWEKNSIITKAPKMQ